MAGLEEDPASKPSITIRRAELADIPLIHALTQQAYAELYSLIPYSSIWSEQAEDIAAELAEGPILLAILDGTICGSIRYHREPAGAEASMYLHRLAVLPAYRRRGVGRALVQAVEQDARRQQIGWIRLEVRAAQPENIEFYLKLGYELGPPTQFLPDGRPRSLLMTKKITR